MRRSSFNPPSPPRPFVSRNLIVEALESRYALSVCGVTCLVEDGQLNISGTGSDDSIAVQYDSSANLLRVIGAGGELVGQYPAAGLRSLYIDGLAGNDQFELAADLPFSIRLNGGEGEDALVSAAHSGEHTHDHGSAVVFNIEQFHAPDVSPIGSPFAPNLGLTALLTPSATATSPAFLSSVDHAAHGSRSTEANVALHSSHAASMHDASEHGAMDGIAHPHSSSITRSASAAALATGGVAAALSANSATAAGDDFDATEHERHSALAVNAEVSTKVAPKRCTTTYVARELNRSIYGERKCDCEKKQAVQDAAQRVADAPADLVREALAAVAEDCLPCQEVSFWSIPPGGVEMCVLGVHTLVETPLSMSAEIARSSRRHPSGEVASDSSDSLAAWSSELRIAGLALVAVGATLPVLFWEQRRSNLPAVDDVMSQHLDWLAGCLRC